MSTDDSGPGTELPAKAGRKIHGLDAVEREAQRREQILESALTLFADHGYANTSVEQVCAGANVSTKSFYRIFDNREALYLAVYDAFRAMAFERMSATITEVSSSEATAEERLVDALVSTYFDDARWALVIQGPSRAVTPTIERVRRDTRKGAAEFLEAAWRQFGLSGNYSGIAVAVVGGIFDLFTNALADGRPLTDQELADLRLETRRFYRAVRAGLAAVF
ncbi:MAG TPA: TetR/AcrR family transcriptional regulator [Nocardioidaceae bacterium]|nr:TetR/AcrR family transcriptional regulator [Nocardioidaceae bacterium]